MKNKCRSRAKARSQKLNGIYTCGSVTANTYCGVRVLEATPRVGTLLPPPARLPAPCPRGSGDPREPCDDPMGHGGSRESSGFGEAGGSCWKPAGSLALARELRSAPRKDEVWIALLEDFWRRNCGAFSSWGGGGFCRPGVAIGLARS